MQLETTPIHPLLNMLIESSKFFIAQGVLFCKIKLLAYIYLIHIICTSYIFYQLASVGHV